MAWLVLAVVALVAGGASAWPRAASWPDEAVPTPAAGDFEFLLLHTNDMHSRFDETSASSGVCTPTLKEQNKCYGGFARVAHVVREARRQAADGTGPPAIFLNAGDTYQGTVWYIIHKHRIVTAMLNKLAPDAVSLGNHEFDDGPAGLAPFLLNAEFPVLAANVNVTREPELQQPRLLPMAELSPVPGKHKIGVVGYLTPETANISFTGNVTFEDEVTAIRREAGHLKERGVDIIIALGHSGYDVDLKIAQEVEDVDVVVGGHTNTFLYTGDVPPDTEKPADLYPTVVTQASGRKVPVVQAYAYTKYMGRLRLVFDSRGELRSFEGNPLLLNASVEQDEDVKRELEEWRPAVEARTAAMAGRADVLLQGHYSICRTQECTLGNLVADAFVQYHARRLPPQKFGWTDASVALQHSGGLRSNVDSRDSPTHNVTVGQLLNALPFENRVVRCTLKGDRLRGALEWSVRRYDPKRVVSYGEFLQFSGLRVTYDLRQPVGRRVAQVLVLCAHCDVPDWEPLGHNTSYGVLMPVFLVQGGDGYGLLQEMQHTPACVTYNYSDQDVVIEHFKRMSPVATALDGRIVFDPPVEVVAEAMAKVTGSGSFVTPVPILLVSLLAAHITQKRFFL